MHQALVSRFAMAACLFLLPCCVRAGAEGPEGVTAADASDPPAHLEIPDTIRMQILEDSDRFLAMQAKMLYRFNPSGTVTGADVALHRSVDEALERSRRLGQYLAFDLDGDGTVTRDEFDRFPQNRRSVMNELLNVAFQRSDANGNGKLEVAELLAVAREETETRMARRRQDDPNPMIFDRDGDGQVDVRELKETVDATLAEFGPIATGETDVSLTQLACRMPEPSEGAEVVIVSGYEGAALSSVAVNGFNDETTVATLTIEKGNTPLYIFANTYDPVIWQVGGDVGRVERFVAQPRVGEHGPGTGVVGLPAEKVSFVIASGCGPHAYQPESKGAELLKASVSAAIGRSVERLVGGYKLDNLAVPSGTMLPGPARTNGVGQNIPGSSDSKKDFGPAKSALALYHPRGLTMFDPEDVVSRTPVQTYDVFPSQAGLLQLLKAGSLSIGPNGNYIIEKPIPRFPSGLYGGHSVTFVLKKGVPMPKGDPGHSAVLWEDTGLCAGAICPSDE